MYSRALLWVTVEHCRISEERCTTAMLVPHVTIYHDGNSKKILSFAQPFIKHIDFLLVVGNLKLPTH